MKIRQILNEDAFDALYTEADELDDREEGAAREALLDAVGISVANYNKHVIEYEYRRYCASIAARGLRFRSVDLESVTRMWDTFFASHISEETRREIHYYTDFRWHMFSHRKAEAKTESAARQAFNRRKKAGAYLFIECTGEAWYIENAGLLKARDFDVDFYFERRDVCIFDEQGRWAYVQTHESDCGPYYHSVK